MIRNDSAARLLPWFRSAIATAWSRVSPALLAFLFFLYGVSILLWLVDLAAGMFLPPRWMGGFFGLFGIFGFGFAIFIWALSSPRSWVRWRIAGLALLLGALALWVDVGPVTRWSNERFLRQPELNAFAAGLHRYGRISEMREWNGDVTHSLNGTVVRRTRAELDSVSPWLTDDGEVALLGDVLARDSIEPAVYDRVRAQVERFHLGSVSLQGEYVLFRRTRDGGLVYATEGAAPLERGAVVPGTDFLVGERVAGWYFFWCCDYPAAPAPVLGAPGAD